MRILFSLALLLSVIAGEAQVVRGRVSDYNSGVALANAVVIWQNTDKGQYSKDDGTFELEIHPTSNTLIISYSGYESDTITYTGQKFINVLLRLPKDAGVVIEGQRSSTQITSLNPLNFQTLGKKELCKAACCNLSESFETNASIDAAYADGITGTKQIRMLGLDGKYTQMMFDNMPAIRGLASTYGLTYVPGPWINNIYIAKGVGSVTGGFESITGQINVEFKSPDTAEPLLVNAYLANSGRAELNLVWAPQHHHEEGEEHHHEEGHDHEHGEHDHEHEEGEEHAHSEEEHHHEEGEEHHPHVHPVLLAHGAMSTLRTDMNGDGFLDNPLFNNIILRNEWHIAGNGGLGSQIAATYIHLNSVSGKLEYDPQDEIKSQLWGVNVTTNRYELSAKLGYVFPDKPWKSIGSQWNGSYHDQTGQYGFRQYLGQQWSGRANVLFASRIKNDNHKFTTGVSYMYDDYTERLFFDSLPPIPLESYSFSRLETVAGAFFEYTWNWKERLVAVGGLRGDYHNRYGAFFTPRFHMRYSFTEMTSVKLLAGKGYRTANLLMDNVGILASNRRIHIDGNDPNGYFGLKMEEAWNTGIIFTHKFKMFKRDGVISVDAYRTQFKNQVVVDMETPQHIHFYNLEGDSYSNSVQIETQIAPFKRLEWRLAYRWLDVKTQYTSGLLEKPLVNKHRAFTNLAYATREKANGRHWRFDFTWQWIGTKRLPNSGPHVHDEVNTSTSRTNPYSIVNAQITFVARKQMEFYLGGENLTNFMLHSPIISADNPGDPSFDGSLVWGPVFGRMGYIGLRCWI